MTTRFYRALFVGALFVSTALLGSNTLFAQTAEEGLQIKPAVIEDRVDAGELYQFTVKVTNIADVQKTFFLSTQDIKGLDEKGLPIFAEQGEATGYELSSWVVLPTESVTLGAGETRNIPFSIQVPANASPGAHFGGIFMDARPEKLRTTGTSIGVMVGTIINLRIAGEVTEDAFLREFSTEQLMYSAPPVNFNTRIENRGNVLLRPTGLIEITDMFGKKVASVRLNESAAPVFPQSDKVYVTTWEHEGFAFGKYTAIASLVYGEDVRKTVSGSTSFWILPMKPLLITLGVFAATVLVVYLMVQSYIRRKLRDMGVAGSRRSQRSSMGSRVLIILFSAVLVGVVFFGIAFVMFA